MVPKIEELLRYADVNNFSDIQQLKEILNSFITGTFRPVGISPVKYTQGEYMAGRERYNELAGEILTTYNDIIDYSNKTDFTDKQIAEIQHEINSLKKIGMKVKTDKDITIAIIDRLVKSKVILDKYIQIIFKDELADPQQPIEEVDQPARAVGQLFQPAVDLFAEDPVAEGERLVAQQAEAERQGIPVHYLQGEQLTPAEERKRQVEKQVRLLKEARTEIEQQIGEKIYFTFPEWRDFTKSTSRHYYTKYRDDLILRGVDRNLFG